MRRIDLKKIQPANSHTIRDINRQIVLNYVREKEPISRAAIARETALQRSTISEIVEELTDDGLYILRRNGDQHSAFPHAASGAQSARAGHGRITRPRIDRPERHHQLQ